MYWEEKLDHLKRKLSKNDFRDPFTEWAAILKKIEHHFIIKNHPGQHFNYWSENIKAKQLVKKIKTENLAGELQRIGPGVHFWFVMVYGNIPSAKHLVYDCTTKALLELLPYVIFDFYIISKKYEWFSYFKINPDGVEIYKSGNTRGPFN